jgi:phage tail-like protein
MATLREDPYPAYNYLVEVAGLEQGSAQAGFSEVSGLSAEITVIEYRNGNEHLNTVRKLPGLVKYPNIILKRGVTGDLTLWQWISQAIQGNAQRINGSIVLLDEGRNPVLRWKFRRGWPCRYEGPTLAARGNQVAIETLEICHEGLEID